MGCGEAGALEALLEPADGRRRLGFWVGERAPEVGEPGGLGDALADDEAELEPAGDQATF